MLLAGGSAVAYGLWKRDRVGWPLLFGGTFLLYRAGMETILHNTTSEVRQTINRSPAEIYAFLLDFKNWPLFMKGLKSLQSTRTETAVWGTGQERTEAWSKIVEAQPNKLLRWTTAIGNGMQQCAIELHEAPGNRGTEVHWHVEDASQRNVIGELFSSSTGESLEQRARESLRALKQLLETGEVATTDGQPHGMRGLKGKAERIAFRENVDEARRPPRQTDLPSQELAAS